MATDLGSPAPTANAMEDDDEGATRIAALRAAIDEALAELDANLGVETTAAEFVAETSTRPSMSSRVTVGPATPPDQPRATSRAFANPALCNASTYASGLPGAGSYATTSRFFGVSLSELYDAADGLDRLARFE